MQKDNAGDSPWAFSKYKSGGGFPPLNGASLLSFRHGVMMIFLQSLQRWSGDESPWNGMSLSCHRWRARFRKGAAVFMGGHPMKAMGPRDIHIHLMDCVEDLHEWC